jgi:putative Holliday junction resolvase
MSLPSNPSGRILAIDFGLKRCGIAVSDPFQLIATALETIDSRTLSSFLKNYLAKEIVATIVIGEPKNLDNSPAEIHANVLQLAEYIKENFPTIPVHLEDERYTSKIAAAAMLSGNMKKKDRRVKGAIDKVSAVLILQSFMEKIKFTPS